MNANYLNAINNNTYDKNKKKVTHPFCGIQAQKYYLYQLIEIVPIITYF